jgi:hypothetical protein
MNLGFSVFLTKTALWDFDIRYKLKTIVKIAGIESMGKEIILISTVEYFEMKKLKESMLHTTKNKIIIIN